jgi:hypothetical protein
MYDHARESYSYGYGFRRLYYSPMIRHRFPLMLMPMLYCVQSIQMAKSETQITPVADLQLHRQI